MGPVQRSAVGSPEIHQDSLSDLSLPDLHVLKIQVAVSPKVSGAAVKGEGHGNPLSGLCKRDNPGPTQHGPSEECFADGSPLRVAHDQEGGQDGGDLGYRLVFAESLGGQNNILGGRQQAQSGDSQFSANNHRDHPGFDLSEFDEGDEGRTGENLVRQRVHERSEGSDQLALTGNFSIQEVGETRQAEENQSPRAISWKRCKCCHPKQSRQRETGDSQLVGEIHRRV